MIGDIRRAGDVNPLMMRQRVNQGTHVPPLASKQTREEHLQSVSDRSRTTSITKRFLVSKAVLLKTYASRGLKCDELRDFDFTPVAP